MVRTSADTMFAGHLLQVTYLLEGARARSFHPPEFTGFTLVNGPQQSSSMQINNGKVTQEAAFTYLLTAPQSGTYSLEPAEIKVGSAIYSCPRKRIVVLPNPEGIPDPQFPGWRVAPDESAAPTEDPRYQFLRKRKKAKRL